MALTGYEKYKVEDNAQGQLNAGIASWDTSIVLKSGEGANFPSSWDYICTLIQFDGSGYEETNVVKREKVLVTARTTDTLTVTRGFDGSTATSFSADDYLVLTVTASLLEDIQDAISNLDTNKLETDALRSGLWNRKVVYTNWSGGETELALGSSQQVLTSNGASSAPTFQTPTVDINSLTNDETLDTDDKLIFYDNTEGANNKRTAKASTTNPWLVEMLTDVEATTGTDEERYMNAKQAKDNYQPLINVVTGSRTSWEGAGSEDIAHWLSRTPKFVLAFFDSTNRTWVWFYWDSAQSSIQVANSWHDRIAKLIDTGTDWYNATVTALDWTNLTVTWADWWGSADTSYTLMFIW